MVNKTNDKIDETGEPMPAEVITGADEAPGATEVTRAGASDPPAATGTSPVTVLKSKIFGAVKRTTGR